MAKPENDDSDILFRSGSAVYAMSMPYIIGARLQIERYSDAYRLIKSDSVTGVYRCIHEISNLYEDLDMLRRYTRGLGIDLWDEKIQIENIRNAIRHDARKEINSKNNQKLTKARASSLGLNEGLMFALEFKENSIKMGDQEIAQKEVAHYVNVAEKLLTARSLGIEEVYKTDEQGDHE